MLVRSREEAEVAVPPYYISRCKCANGPVGPVRRCPSGLTSDCEATLVKTNDSGAAQEEVTLAVLDELRLDAIESEKRRRQRRPQRKAKSSLPSVNAPWYWCVPLTFPFWILDNFSYIRSFIKSSRSWWRSSRSFRPPLFSRRRSRGEPRSGRTRGCRLVLKLSPTVGWPCSRTSLRLLR